MLVVFFSMKTFGLRGNLEQLLSSLTSIPIAAGKHFVLGASLWEEVQSFPDAILYDGIMLFLSV